MKELGGICVESIKPIIEKKSLSIKNNFDDFMPIIENCSQIIEKENVSLYFKTVLIFF